MNKDVSLALMIVAIIMLASSMLFNILSYPVHSSIQLILLIFLIYLCFDYRKKTEKYDYDRENPNALITGKLVGGSVFASYPENSPGLGWIM